MQNCTFQMYNSQLWLCCLSLLSSSFCGHDNQQEGFLFPQEGYNMNPSIKTLRIVKLGSIQKSDVVAVVPSLLLMSLYHWECTSTERAATCIVL